MKKSFKNLIVGLILIIGSTIISIIVVKTQIHSDASAILFGLGRYIVILIGAGFLGSFFTKSRANYSWHEIRFDKKFQIIKILGNEPTSPRIKAEVYVEDFGDTIILFPSDLSFWEGKQPEEGQSFKRKGINLFILINP